MTTRYLSLAAAVCAAVTLSACGGGSNGSIVPPQGASSSPSPATSLSTTFVFNIPSGSSTSSAAKHRLDVSSDAGSVYIALQSVNGKPNTSVQLTLPIGAGARGCTATSTGTSCSVTVGAVAGTDVYAISSYQSNNATGPVLGTAMIPVNVTQATTATTQVSLGGVPAKLSFSPAKLPLVNDGNIHRVPVTVNAADASGATIVGSAPYQSPVSLQVLNDSSHALTLSTTSVSQPGTVVTVTYDSSKPLSNAQIVASYTGLQSATAVAAPLTINQTPLALFDDGSNPSSVQVTEAGFTGTFTASIANTAVATEAVVNGTTGSGNAVVNVAAAPNVRLNATTLSVSDGDVSVSIPITVIPKPGTYTAYGAEHIMLGPLGLTKGPDGRLWTADGPSGNMVAFDTTAHTYQKYLVDATSEGPSQFAFDGSGNIWFADQKKIGELNPANSTVTTYSTGLSAAPNVIDVIAGAPGSNTMWFYDVGANTPAHGNQPTWIGSINTTNGQITEYPTPNNAIPIQAVAVPMSMVMGPDNGVWFADGFHFLIWRFDATTHAFTQYNPSTPSYPTQSPQALAVGPDGNIWFTSAWQNGSAPETSLMSEIQLKNGDAVQTFNDGIVPSDFWTLVPSSDNNLWFTQNAGGNIGITQIGVINPATATIGTTPNTNTVAYYQYFQAITPQFALISNVLDGGDGKTLWTLDTNNGQIGEVTFK